MSASHLIFLHLPKTGGMTLRGLFARNYKGQIHLNTELDHPTQAGWLAFLARLDALTPAERAKIRVVKGHMPFGVHTHLEGESEYVSFLRHPTKRIVSLHTMFQRKGYFNRDGKIDPALPNWGWEDETPGLALDNGQTRMMAGADFDLPFGTCTRDHLEQAKRNIETSFSFVGLMERFDTSLMLLHRALNWKWRFYVADNVAPDRTSAAQRFTPEVLQALEQLNQYDFQLYAFVEERMNAEIARLSPRVEMEERVYRTCNGAHQWWHRVRHTCKGRRTSEAAAPEIAERS